MTGPVRNGEEGSGAGSSGTKAPRPPNSWIIYRSDKMREMTQPRQKAGGKGMTQADLSRVIANMWKTETDAVRGEYERRAEIKKAEHYARFPNYRFQPVKKEERVQQKKAAVALKAANAAEETTRRRVKPSSGLRTPPVSAASRSRVASASSRAQPQVEQYGPCGPSPPISAASTPEFLPFDSPPRQPSPIDMPPSAYPPIPLSPNFQQHQQHTAADTILRPMTPPEDIINFNIPEMAAGLNYGLHDLHNWNFQPDPSLIEQTESLQYDIQSQQLVNLDGTPLTSAPPGGFELQMGQFPGLAFSLEENWDTSWFTPENALQNLSPYAMPPQDPSQIHHSISPSSQTGTSPAQDATMNTPIHAPVPSSSSMPYVDTWSLDQPVTATESMSTSPTVASPTRSHPSPKSPSTSSHNSPVRTQRASPRPHPYAPPGGAPKHSQRRAGGTWRPPVQVPSSRSSSYSVPTSAS